MCVRRSCIVVVLAVLTVGITCRTGTAQVRSNPAAMRQVFDLAARGRGYFLIAEMGPLRGPLSAYANRHQITDGKITFDHFAAFAQELKAQANGTLPAATETADTKQAAPPPRGSPESIKLWAARDFGRRDRNGDGRLNFDEMSSTLRGDLYHWDKSRDNLIDLEEYKEYFLERVQRRSRGSSTPGTLTVILEDSLDARPQVYRAGNLPEKGLPKWFGALDTDKDGQVALYEWYEQGRELTDFESWDRDDDGLVTPKEALQQQAILEEQDRSGD